MEHEHPRWNFPPLDIDMKEQTLGIFKGPRKILSSGVFYMYHVPRK